MGLGDYAGGVLASGSTANLSVIQNGNTISNVQAYANQLAKEYILQPKGMKGIAGFVFDYEGDDQIQLESDITDHYAEDNSSVQDHIALKPYRITLRGFVTELFFPALNSGIFGALNTLTSTLQSVPAYLGKYTPQALQTLSQSASGVAASVENYANTAAQYLNQAQNIVNLFAGSGAETRQQKAFASLAALRDSRQIFQVVTPWTLVKNVAIDNLMFIQPKESVSRSDIVVTLKQMRFVDININTGPSVLAQYGGRAAQQAQGQTLNGSTPGTPVGGPTSGPLGPLSISGL